MKRVFLWMACAVGLVIYSPVLIYQRIKSKLSK